MSASSPPSRRSALTLAAAVTAGAAMAVTPPAQAAAATRHADPGPRPTIVLVHGAWADASGWSTVAGHLQDAGHTVVAPAVPLRGLASDAAYLAALLEVTPGPPPGGPCPPTPSYALVARADRTIPPAAERFMAWRAGAHTVEADAPHAVHLTHPETVVRLIRRAAKETS